MVSLIFLYRGSDWFIFLITPGSAVLGSQELVLHAVLLSTLSQIHSNISIYKTLLLLKQHTPTQPQLPRLIVIPLRGFGFLWTVCTYGKFTRRPLSFRVYKCGA